MGPANMDDSDWEWTKLPQGTSTTLIIFEFYD